MTKYKTVADGLKWKLHDGSCTAEEIQTIHEALKIAEKLMQGPTDTMVEYLYSMPVNDPFVVGDYLSSRDIDQHVVKEIFKAMRDQLLKEIDLPAAPQQQGDV